MGVCCLLELKRVDFRQSSPEGVGVLSAVVCCSSNGTAGAKGFLKINTRIFGKNSVKR